MSKLQKLEFESKTITERIRKEMSVHSENIRLKLKHISNFKADFDSTYAGFLEKDLPRDERFL